MRRVHELAPDWGGQAEVAVATRVMDHQTRPTAGALIPILLVVGLFYTLVIGLRIRHYNDNISSLIDAGQKVVAHEPGVLGRHVVVFRDSTGYDGLAYYVVADDPFLRHPQIRDAFRYQRIVYPLLIWAASLGRRSWRPAAMAGVNVIAVLAITLIAVSIITASGRGTSPWWAVACAVNPSLIIGVEYDLAEPVVIALCLLGLLFYIRRQLVATTVALAVAMLTREVAILFLIPLLLAEIGARRFRRTVVLALSVAPYVVWQEILARTFGQAGAATSRGNLDRPFVGIMAVLQEARRSTLRAALVHQGSILGVLVFTIVALVVAAVWARKRYDVVVGAILVHAVASLFGGTAIWVAYASAARVFGGIYPLTIFAFARHRSAAFYALAVGGILITLFTFIRLVVINPALPYYVTP